MSTFVSKDYASRICNSALIPYTLPPINSYADLADVLDELPAGTVVEMREVACYPVLVRRGAGPLDHTMALVDPADFGGSGSPGGNSGEVQYNNAGAFAGAADVEIEGGQLRLPSIATPTAPASGGLKVYGATTPGIAAPAFIGAAGGERLLQTMLGIGQVCYFVPASGTTVHVLGAISAGTGTATASTLGTGSRRDRMPRIEYLVTVASTSAVAGWRSNVTRMTVGGASAWEGGFNTVMHWGPATGGATATHRGFCGLWDSAAPSDVEPSSLTILVGMGWDAADTNIQFMHNDAAGTATKVDLGASFPVPSADRANTYRLEMYSPPGSTQSVSYRVTNLETGATATGVVTTNLPSTSTLLCNNLWMSVGGTNSVIGVAVGPIISTTEY